MSTECGVGETRTTCPYCGVGCGVIVRPDGAGGFAARGDPDHPANFGKLCSKGAALGETLGLDGRLLHPEVDGRRVGWDAALAAAAGRLGDIIARHGPEAVAFYLSGQLLTEDYYVANKLAKGFIGTPHVDTNSRLCMASTVAGHKRAFGADAVPNGYEDLDTADLVIFAGSNAAWCHPVLFQRVLANRERRGARIVSIDVRPTDTAAMADLALTIAPGSDAALWNGLLAWLDADGAIDRAFLAAHCEGYDAALAAARASAPSPASTAAACGVPAAAVEAFFALFARTARTVTCYSQGVNQSSSGTDKVGAILNCHLATGRIGRPGAGPLSLTGQANAMGGREAGGLANQLAAHMDYAPEAIDRVRRFWRAPRLAQGEGLKAAALFDAVLEGRIKALWILCTNPAVSLPDAAMARAALARAELVIVSDCVAGNDTLEFADIRLPAATWGEKDGTVTNSERRISRQRAFLPPPGEARPDWRALCAVADRLGFGAAFAFRNPAAIFREYAALTAFENTGGGRRALDLSGLADCHDQDYDALAPVQWPVRGKTGTARLFGAGDFLRANGRALLAPVVPRPPAEAPTAAYPVTLNTGRARDHWHSMTRTGRSPRLSRHRAEPYVEVSPQDAARFGLEDGGLARAASALGEATLRVMVAPDMPAGRAFAPIHWSDANASAATVGRLIAAHVDPVSGQPEFKATPVRLGPLAIGHAALLLSRRALRPRGTAYWSQRRGGDRIGGDMAVHVMGFAAEPAEGWRAWTAGALNADEAGLIEYRDDAQGCYRAALLDGDRALALLAVTRGARPPAADPLEALFNAPADRRVLLSLVAAAGGGESGPLVCSCFGVGAGEIAGLAASEETLKVEDIGRRLKAGTGCGSCLPEIRRLLAAQADRQ